jgi:hypothetical protein
MDDYKLEMKLFVLVLTFIIHTGVWSQSSDGYVQSIEKARRIGQLTSRSSTEKTAVGSVTAYYKQDALVLIASLTDAEAAGTETLYFFKDGVLKKVFIMAATFRSHNEWKDYYAGHTEADRCFGCHGQATCTVTEVTFGNRPTITVLEQNKRRESTGVEKDKMLEEVRRTSEELKILAEEFK